MPNHILLSASSRPDGNTAVITEYLAERLGASSIDLSAHYITPYRYDQEYPENDQHWAIMERLLDIEHWILITPIYWYTMSAQMKTFLDRISDLLTLRNEAWLPRLTGKTMWVVAVGSEAVPTPHFFDPFRLSAEYLGMYYGGDLHTWLGRVPVMKPEVQPLLDDFAKTISAKK